MDRLSIDGTRLKTLILAADGAFVSVRPDEDHIWSLNLDTSDAHPFYLHTTYNLRAQSMRLFPNITINNQRMTKAVDLTKLPTINQYTPGYLYLEYEIEQELVIQFDCFIPEAGVLVGGINLLNHYQEPINVTLEIAAILVPMGKGVPSSPQKIGINHIITGQSNRLWPVLFMTGGPIAITNPCPALSLSFQLMPEQSRVLTWSLVTKDSIDASFETARKVTATPWREEAQKQVKYHASRTISLQTGDQDWDTAFTLSQLTAMSHFFSGRGDKATPWFIDSRLPDKAINNGTTQESIDTLTTLSAIHLGEVLLPAHCSIWIGVIEDFISRINHEGRLPSRLTGNGSAISFQECPLLGQLCLDVFEIHQDKDFLKQVFSSLCLNIESWLQNTSGVSEEFRLAWENPQQLQLDTGLFVFDIWEETGRGLDIQTVESPALATMLLREVKAVRKIARILGDTPREKLFLKFEKTLKRRLGEFWQDDQQRFSYRDRQSHLPSYRELYYPLPAQETIEIKKFFTRPQRLQCHIISNDEHKRTSEIQIKGVSPSGEEIKEVFSAQDIRWVSGRTHLTTQHLFKSLDSVSFNGLQPEDQVLLETVDLSQKDITQILPVWSGNLRKNQLQAILEESLDWQKPELQFGIPEIIQGPVALPDDLPVSVNVLWNTLVIKGLVNEGYHEQAANLFSNLMETIVAGLKHYDGFFPFYDRQNGRPTGTRNAITGLIPVRLFLQIAGIRLFTPNRLAIWGFNPFPWPINLQWQGLALRKEGANTQITFPDGTIYHSDSQKPVLLMPGEILS